ncbi:MAG: HD domain-containing protein [Alphaproteobacteria bacterium]|nr:HD domain-containing protein [Alphaproteobacteria bacterium]
MTDAQPPDPDGPLTDRSIVPEVAEAIRLLERAQQRVGAGVQDDLETVVRNDGARLAQALVALLRMTRTHDVGNAAFERPVVDLGVSLRRLVDRVGVVQLVVVEDEVYVNDIRVRPDGSKDMGARLERHLARHGLGGLSFHERCTPIQLRMLVDALSLPPSAGDPRRAMARVLAGRGLGAIELHGEFRYKMSSEREPAVPESEQAAGDLIELDERASAIIQVCWDNLGSNRMPPVAQVRRIVAELVKHSGPGVLVYSEELPVGQAYTAHVRRVTHVCLIVGRALGLNEEQLEELGVAAMFHDVGYAVREGVIMGDDGAVRSRGFAPPFARHGSAGARLLLKARGFSPGKLRRALATFEHHRDLEDHRGVPQLYGRIVRLAEDYDNLIRARGAGFPPPEALARMKAWAGIRYDPTLLQLMINTLGAYPPGTVLELEDRQVVRSMSTVRYPGAFALPLCEVVQGPDGMPPPQPITIDLARQGTVARVLRATRRPG